jgi:two-component system, response regulator PdtaR
MSGGVLPLSGPRASTAGGSFSLQPLYACDTGAGTGAKALPARILVVEDDHIVSMEIEHVLLNAGFAVIGIAVSADEAVRMARDQRPDLAVMDIRLIGQRDGVDAAIDIFNQTGIRCIFATAHSDLGTKMKAQPAHPLGWLSKPYTPRALVMAVRDALSGLGSALPNQA